jgi:hypothetical protein
VVLSPWSTTPHPHKEDAEEREESRGRRCGSPCPYSVLGTPSVFGAVAQTIGQNSIRRWYFEDAADDCSIVELELISA